MISMIFRILGNSSIKSLVARTTEFQPVLNRATLIFTGFTRPLGLLLHPAELANTLLLKIVKKPVMQSEIADVVTTPQFRRFTGRVRHVAVLTEHGTIQRYASWLMVAWRNRVLVAAVMTSKLDRHSTNITPIQVGGKK